MPSGAVASVANDVHESGLGKYPREHLRLLHVRRRCLHERPLAAGDRDDEQGEKQLAAGGQRVAVEGAAEALDLGLEAGASDDLGQARLAVA